MADESEQINKTLKSFVENFDKLDFISSINRVYQHSDLPKYYSYSSTLINSRKKTDGHLMHIKNASGISFFSEELALLKCLGESVEREACSSYKNKSLLLSSYRRMNKSAINPLSFKYFTEKQKAQTAFKEFVYDEDTLFRWINGVELISGNKVYIPAQTIYFNYTYHYNEGRIGIPISTGAAGGSTLKSALVRGILESVERDSFMICYLNKISRGKVNLKIINDNQINYLLAVMKRYNLKLNVIDITTDLNIPTYLSIIIDETGLSPAIQVGAKSDLDPITAIIGAISESFISQSWYRELYFEDGRRKNKHIRTLEDRGMYWFDKSNMKKLDFWINQKESKKILQHNNYSEDEGLNYLKSVFNKMKYPIYWTDLTLPNSKDIPYFVIKTIIPELCPLYFNEDFRYLGCDRLYSVPEKLGFKRKEEEELNKIPHPFP